MTKLLPITLAALLAAPVLAHAQAISSPSQPEKAAAFDIVTTAVRSDGADVVFTLQVRADAGELRPKAVGEFAGSGAPRGPGPTG